MKLIFDLRLMLIICCNQIIASGRYLEGHVKSLEDWIFLARFCFLSGRGRYEYHIEFERRYGEPQLLLYYDDETQWPAIYKKGKTCPEKLEVLNPQDNQIVTLSARSPYNMVSGCALRTSNSNRGSTLKPNIGEEKTSPRPIIGDLNASYFDQFLESTTTQFADDNDDGGDGGGGSFEQFNVTLFDGTLNDSIDNNVDDVDIFNSTTSNQVKYYIPLGGDIGFHNPTENDTQFNRENVEELFEIGAGENSTKIRIKRSAFGGKSGGSSFVVTCHSSGGFLTSRERWWYIAIANCGNNKGIDVKYKFRMTNGPPGDFWHEHFSADEMYIPPILLAEALVYTFLMLAIIICAIELKNRHLFHCTYRLFAMSAGLQYISVLFLGVAWSKYAVHGVGPYTGVGTIFQASAEIAFLILLLLMGKGYTITRARISTCSTVKLTIFVNFYIVCYLSLFIYREEVFDPGEVLNLYESPGGLGLAVLRCIAWAAFLVSITTTTRKSPEKAIFYYPFGILGSMWLLGGPILTFIGIAFFDPWIRESLMYGVLAMLSVSGHASFLWLTWPSRANVNFPYHVRTNHVGVMSASDDGADYPRHVYEPTLTNGTADPNATVIIPLARRSEAAGVYQHYLCERECYNSPSTPVSYVSFPPAAAANGGTGHQQEPSAPPQSNESYDSPQRKDEQQVDSGHPSLDDTPSTTSVKSATAQADENVVNAKGEGNNQLDINDSGGTSSGATFATKPNPFLINTHTHPPNKIILDPINPPVLQHAHRSNTPGDVPTHLFAARRKLNAK